MSGDRVLLADVKILTFTRGERTTHRRVNAVQQLICDDNGSIGCPNKKEYLFESATCINEGIGGNMMPSWSCTASSLPNDTELGSVNVSCEGYTYRDDPYVLAGSCAMEYTLTAPTPQGPFAALLVAFIGLFACCACSKNHKRRPRGGAPPAYHEVSTLLDTTRRAATAPPAPALLPTAHAVHLDDLEKNASGPRGEAGAVATAHPVGTTASATAAGGAEPSGASSTSLAAGAAAGAAATAAAAAAAGVAALASHNRHRKPEDHSLPEEWESKVDPLTGRTYFLNHDTRKTTWTDPRKPSEEQQLLRGNSTRTGANWWTPMNRMRSAPIRGGTAAWQHYGHASELGQSSTYQGATTSGRGDGDSGHASTTHGGTTGRGNDHTSTAHGGTSGRDGGGGGGGWGSLFGGGGGGDHSSTAHGGTTDRGGGGGGWGGGGGGGGGGSGFHSSSASGGTSGR